MKKLAQPFASEADLCAAFLGAIDADLWTAYAESCGWDILLSRKSDGLQIGIQAKRKLNVEVINQAIERSGFYAAQAAPDCRAVLVPSPGAGFGLIADYIGLTVITVGRRGGYRPSWVKPTGDFEFRPELPKPQDIGRSFGDWHEWCPIKRHTLPEYVPDVRAGSPSPLQLTAWKIAAIKIAVILERRGFVTRADFKSIGIDHRRWLTGGMAWLRVSEGRYIAAPLLPDFKAMHARNYAEIAADWDKWAPKPAGELL